MPDFYFRDFNTWAEVKPKPLNNFDLLRCKELSSLMNHNSLGVDVLLLEGSSIDRKSYRTIVNGDLGGEVCLVANGEDKYPFFSSDRYDKKNYFLEETNRAITEARSARFEFEWKSR